MKIIWSAEAIDNLSQIELYIAQDSPERARSFRKYLFERSRLISKNPYLGRIVPELSDAKIRELILKNYRVVYQVKKHQIDPLTVTQ